MDVAQPIWLSGCPNRGNFIANKKDMKPFHIDRELECPILF